jgi:hypothetical protein
MACWLTSFTASLPWENLFRNRLYLASEAAPQTCEGLRVSKAAWEQHRLGEAVSLMAGPKFVKGKSPDNSSSEVGRI